MRSNIVSSAGIIYIEYVGRSGLLPSAKWALWYVSFLVSARRKSGVLPSAKSRENRTPLFLFLPIFL